MNSEVPVPEGLHLRPIRGVRFTVPDIAAITSPPYDLIDTETVRNLLDAHPNNVVRLILPGTHYAEARTTLDEWLAAGILTVDERPALYLYEQQGPSGPPQRGLIGAVGLADPAQGVILPHENVFPGPVADRLALMRTTEANLEPIFLLYEGGGETSRIVEAVAGTPAGGPEPDTGDSLAPFGIPGGAEPPAGDSPDEPLTEAVLGTAGEPLTETVTDDGIRHRLWSIADPELLARIDRDLGGRRALIADGHHRYATYRALQRERHEAGEGTGPWDYGLALLVDSTVHPPGLQAIHRVVPGLTVEEAAAKAQGVFRIREFPGLPQALEAMGDPSFLLAGDGRVLLLDEPDPLVLAEAMPRERSSRWRALGTSILHELLIPRLWGIEEDEGSVLMVHHDPEAAVRLAERTAGVAVVLRPLLIRDVLDVAARGERVIRKSTSFSPKPRTGFVMRTFSAG
ncbi:DUF1015 family protein [Rhizohabitans arisaemae]|uniref:DUF1015 family protein n=1 Tax=Rhizohabitans arisaemae TaxID=2720610 RepID=UPI0024B0FE5B|nr:DUF1015 family protein [Rhizohabitans arisaemae]